MVIGSQDRRRALDNLVERWQPGVPSADKGNSAFIRFLFRQGWSVDIRSRLPLSFTELPFYVFVVVSSVEQEGREL